METFLIKSKTDYFVLLILLHSKTAASCPEGMDQVLLKVSKGPSQFTVTDQNNLQMCKKLHEKDPYLNSTEPQR